MEQYLSTAPIIETHSLKEARDALTRVYSPHDLVGPNGAMRMCLNAVTDRHMTFGYLTYQADIELTMPATENCHHVNLTITGETRASRIDGCRELTAARQRGLVLSPCGPPSSGGLPAPGN